MASRFLKLFPLFLFLLCGSHLFAQTSTGTIVGQVQDPSGAALPGATVKLTLVANGTSRETKTDAGGAFSAPVIPPGEYAITVVAPGFADKTLRGVTLLVDQTLNLTINMEVG